MPDTEFPHIQLLFRDKGDARLTGGRSTDPRVRQNQENRQGHSRYLSEAFRGFAHTASALLQERERANLPEIPGGVPFMLQIPDEDDEAIEFVAETLGLEVVAEYKDGFLIVASEDLAQERVLEVVEQFQREARGSGKMARILDVDNDPHSPRRIERLLADDLKDEWPFRDNDEWILDVSIEVSPFGRPQKPKGISSRTRPETRERKLADYERKRQEYFERWDEEKRKREETIERFIHSYEGQMLRLTDDSHIVDFPDSFSARIQMSGKGFKDLIYNYPNLFEVTRPDDVRQPFDAALGGDEEVGEFELRPPPQDAPAICIVDSGIQERHRLLTAAIDSSLSRCFIPGKSVDDIADYVRSGGHGTRVAGACLYPQSVPRDGDHEAPFWLLNARVLDENNDLIDRIFPPAMLREIVRHYKSERGVRIYNHSIGSRHPCRTSRMSVWAATIDLLSYEDDILIIQAAGNIATEGSSRNPGIVDHFIQGRDYPGYLYEPSSRLSNPAQSLQALTVGSVAASYYEDQDRRSLARPEEPSSFTRTGFGLWDSIKPEVVEFGGDDVIDSGNPPSLTTPPDVCPELVRSTLNGGPPVARDTVGTSFAAPKVTHIAGHLERILPEHDTLLYRALIVNSARWPNWAEQAPVESRVDIFRSIGYGVPDLSRATENAENRITLISQSPLEIRAAEGLIFGVPIPAELRAPGNEFNVRIDVTLSYAAEPRRTRKSRRGYLGVWADWKGSKKREPFTTFRGRALTDMNRAETEDEDNFAWTIGNKRRRDGTTEGVTRGNGTVQKDWTISESYELPEIFGIVVRGHKGWARHDPEATARFALAVSFEAVGTDIRVYEKIKESVEIELEREVPVDAGQIRTD